MNRQGHPPQVYVIQNDVGACKIGVSGVPQSRLAELQRQFKVRLQLVAACQCPIKLAWTVEHRAHRLLADRRLDGEWFNVSADEAVEAVSRAMAVVEAGQPVAPGWSIPSMSTKARLAARRMARREGLTVGQWLERRVAEWEAEGSPVPVVGASPKPEGPLGRGATVLPTGSRPSFAVAVLDLAGLAQLLGALGTLPEGGLRRDAERTTRAVLRQARGLAPVRGRARANADGVSLLSRA